jgi:hypothetical protein
LVDYEECRPSFTALISGGEVSYTYPLSSRNSFSHLFSFFFVRFGDFSVFSDDAFLVVIEMGRNSTLAIL